MSQQKKIDHLIGDLRSLFSEKEAASPAQQRLMQELERHRHPAGSADKPDPRPVETLERLLEEYEEEHPQVSAVLGQIINALKNMGV